MQYPTVSVNGVSVRIGEEGRYNLNDLHAAAVANGEATESQRPSVFLRSAQIKRFVKALEVKAQKKVTCKQINNLELLKVVMSLEYGVSNCWLSDMQHELSRSLKSKFTTFSEQSSVFG